MRLRINRLLAGIAILSLVVNGWLLMENRRLLSAVQTDGTQAKLQVHVVGAVVTPGLFELPRGSRVSDALQAAGGAQPLGDLSGLNLAKPLFDGEQISVPTGVPVTQMPTGENAAPTTGAVGGLININSAGEVELQNLPGIGPVKAAAIVAYRQEHGAFAKPEDIMKVSGIGEKTFEKLKPLVVVR